MTGAPQGSASAVGSGALAPYRIVDLSGADAWLCGKLLADLGADVVKVEPPAGDPGRKRDTDGTLDARWSFANRGKRSLALDLADPAARATLDRLMAGADAVVLSGGDAGIERGRGWATATVGLPTPAELTAAHPSLVVTVVSPFGADGPYAGYGGPDLVVVALSGLQWLTGDPDRPPVRVSMPQAGRLAAAEAALHTAVALVHAARTGRGQLVDVSTLAAMARTTMNATDYPLLEGFELTRAGPGVAYAPGRPRQIYACADGHVTFMATLGPLGGPALDTMRSWARAEGIPVPASLEEVDFVGLTFAELEARGEGSRFVADTERLVETVLARRTKADLYRIALAERMLLAPVNTVADLGHDEQLAARGYWDEVAGDGGGTVTFPGRWARLAATPLLATSAAPAVGAATAELLAEPARRPLADRSPPVARGRVGRPEPRPEHQPRPQPRPERWLEATDPPPEGDPFAGLRVWDLSWVGVGPLTTRYLADYGATVIRLDSSRRADVLRVNGPFAGGVPGINRSQFYADFNASKLGVGLDLETSGGRDVALRLSQWADVVVESFTPKTLRAVGLDYDQLRAVNPGLVMLSTCMQGQTGPRRDYRGFGQLMASLSGFFEVTGWPDRDPSMVYGAYTDFICQRFCALALVAALDHRRRTGQGQHVDVAQFEAALQVLGPELVDHAANGQLATRRGNRHPDCVPHGVYPCRPAGPGLAGQRWIAIACQDDDQWSALVDALGRPGWATDPELRALAGRQAAEDRLDAHLARSTADHDAEELFGRLQPRVAAGPVRSPGALHHDPQLVHLGYFETVEHPVMGRVPYNGAQARLSATPARIRKAAPCLGEDTWTVLTEVLGYGDEEAAELLDSGAVEIQVG